MSRYIINIVIAHFFTKNITPIFIGVQSWSCRHEINYASKKDGKE